MSTIEQIEAAILKLPPSDYQKLVQWLLDLDTITNYSGKNPVSGHSRVTTRRNQDTAVPFPYN